MAAAAQRRASSSTSRSDDAVDGVFVAAGVALQLSFTPPGPGPVLPSKVSVHGGAQAVSNWTQPKPAQMPGWAFQLQPGQSAQIGAQSAARKP